MKDLYKIYDMKDETSSNLNCDVPALWLEHKDALRNFILKRVRDKELTEDVLQDVLLKVYGFCLDKSGVRNVRSWLFQITRNTLIDHLRKQKKYVDRQIPEEVEEDENLAFREALDYIEPLLSFLPEEYKTPVRLADLEGMKQSDIADKLGLSLSATKSRIQRGRDLLRAEFLTCCHFETSSNGGLLSFGIKDSCAPLQKVRENLQK